MRLKSALRRGVAAAVIAGIVVSSGIPAYAIRWDIADGDITVKAGDEGTNRVTQGKTIEQEDRDTVITGESEEHTVTIDTSGGKVDVTFDDLKIDVSGKKEGDGSDDSPVRARTAPSPLRAAKAAQASAAERRKPAATSSSGAAPSRLWAGATRQASATAQAYCLS